MAATDEHTVPVTNTDPRPLRARIVFVRDWRSRTYYHKLTNPLYEWTVRDRRGAIIVGGSRDTLPEAHEEARDWVIQLLGERMEGIRQDEDQVIQCPECGDPARYHEVVSPYGISWSETCETCGFARDDSA